MRVYWSPDYALPDSFDTTAKSAMVAEALEGVPGVDVSDDFNPGHDLDLIHYCHTDDYVEAVLTGEPLFLAESAGVGPWSSGLRDSVLASTAGCARAARSALQDGVAGSLSSGMHHARSDSGFGFCTFNGLALAAWEFHSLGAERVLVVDLDAHGGGGTREILATAGHRWVQSVDVATSEFDTYPTSAKWRLSVVKEASAYLPTVAAMMDEAVASFEPDAVVYNAGMDPHEGCDIGGLEGVTTEMLHRRDRMVFQRFSAVPVAWVLAGGYTGRRMTDRLLTDLHVGTALAALSVSG